jgi:regulator of cell morphogenesis and NO signaling
VTGGYAVPDDACFSYRELYRRLAELEAKTHEHVHVENNVYFPRAVELEENAGTRRRSPSPAERADRPAATECCT